MPPFSKRMTYHLTEQTRTDMSDKVFNSSRAVCKYRKHINNCDISDNSDSYDTSDSSVSRQEQTCLQYLATVSISNMTYLGFGGHGSFEHL